MSVQLLLTIIFTVVMVCVMVISYFLVRRVNKQTETIIQILNSFKSIDTDLKVLTGKVDNYENTARTLGNRNIDIVTSSLTNMSGRLERMDTQTDNRLEQVERRVNNLHQHCSGKLSKN